MIDSYVLLVFALLSVSGLAFFARRSRWWRLAAVPLVMLTLGLALRFCGRTYPGISYPNSGFLNELLNGNGLFTEIGYDLVLALGVADAAFVLLTLFRQRQAPLSVVRSLVALRLALLALVFLIIAYGCYYAVLFREHWSM